ncbi:DNA polymerase III, delta prime chain [Bacillus cereus Rock3-29]|nr:DNA polymerase III, delta prime chain [Bacillus cereus Rock3-29]PDY91504.1 DNA polymerase III subunit delta' [Bacillus toyonensis]
MMKTGGFRMEKYTELEVLISKAKGGDQEAIALLNAITEQMNQFQ